MFISYGGSNFEYVQDPRKIDAGDVLTFQPFRFPCYRVYYDNTVPGARTTLRVIRCDNADQFSETQRMLDQLKVLGHDSHQLFVIVEEPLKDTDRLTELSFSLDW